MDYEPRTIAYLSELVHPPKPPDARPIQRLHNRMFESGSPTYSTFAVTPVGPVLANPTKQPGAASQVAFLADRIQFREELGSLTAEAFGDRILEIAREAAGLREIPLFTAHRVVLRSLVSPRHWPDTRAFLREATFGFGDELSVFGRDAGLFGLRLAFPPTPAARQAFELRIESYQNDPRSLFLEVQATCPPVPVDALEPLAGNVLDAYAFLTDRVLPFVARFDARQHS